MRITGIRASLLVTIFSVAVLGGCAYPTRVVPPDVDKTINYDISYPQIKAEPEKFIGTTVLLGGEIQSIRNLENGTEVEALQIPLDEYDRPVDRYASRGRFTFLSPEFLDKALFVQGSRITIACKVTGSTSERFDQTEVRYPYCLSEFLYLWPPASEYADTYPVYAYPPYGYWGLYWGWWYPHRYWVGPRFRGRVFHR